MANDIYPHRNLYSAWVKKQMSGLMDKKKEMEILDNTNVLLSSEYKILHTYTVLLQELP